MGDGVPYGLRGSTGRAGSDDDDTLAESLWQGPKREAMHKNLPSTSQARLETSQWLTHCNFRRGRNAPTCLSLMKFEQQHHKQVELSLAA